MKVINRNLCIFFIFLLNISTTANAARIHDYRNDPPPADWHVGYGCTWGDNIESTHEGDAGLREYDWYGNYKEITVKQRSNGTYAGTYKEGYERKKDQRQKAPDLN